MIAEYVRWLHTGWPAGTVEKLPLTNADGSTNVAGLYVVGDLTGIPLLKFSADTGARAVQTIVADPAFQKEREDSESGVIDLVVVGGGVSGMAAALEARKAGLDFVLLEGSEPFSTIVNFPRGKPIYTYPTDMTPAGDMRFTKEVKESLLEELREQTLEAGIEPRIARAEGVARRAGALEVDIAGGEPLRARRVIVGIGRSGNFRKLGVPGEDTDKVTNRLHDPKDFTGKDVLVVGGGDSALEGAIALTQCGARVALSYRKTEFSRPKPENVEAVQRLAKDPMADVGVEEPSSERVATSTGRFLKKHIDEQVRSQGSLTLYMGSVVKSIAPDQVTLETGGEEQTLENDAVFTMIGREAPLDFFRRSRVKIRSEWTTPAIVSFVLFLLFCVALYVWKTNGSPLFPGPETFPQNVPELTGVDDRTSLIGTLVISMKAPAFYYTLVYCSLIGIFGWRRIQRRKTPYVKVQTICLFLIQLIPLFLLPEVILPYMGYNGAFDGGPLGSVADELFPLYTRSDTDWPAWGHPRAYWKAYGLVLAWPLFIYNVFTASPNTGWLVISGVQTFVLIPLLIRRWGKGAYCGWICSCGALAETLGDTHRHKMPHGPLWNRLNMVGQAILALALTLLVLRVAGWILGPESWAHQVFPVLVEGKTAGGGTNLLSYKWVVDITLAGIVGVGFYFWFSGRVWCRFACPLAALMHIYARFSKFRILADKKKCISCNVCTSVCHQGIDVMNFANKGLPMEDPECVRCSACVQACPTGVLQFGRIDPRTGEVEGVDRLAASPVLMMESSSARPLPIVRSGLGGTSHPMQ